MNLKVIASGKVTLPNGKEKVLSIEGPVEPCISMSTIQAILSSEEKYRRYRLIVTDPDGQLFDWIEEKTEEGFTIEWKCC
jgi:hypothetical protein